MKIQKISHVTKTSTILRGRIELLQLRMAGSFLPPEKLGELRQIIHGHVSEAGVQEKIRVALSEILSQHGER